MLAYDFYSLIEKYRKTNAELAQRTNGFFLDIQKKRVQIVKGNIFQDVMCLFHEYWDFFLL